MSSISDFEQEMNRLNELDEAVKSYFSLLWAATEGSEEPDEEGMNYWFEEMERLSS